MPSPTEEETAGQSSFLTTEGTTKVFSLPVEQEFPGNSRNGQKHKWVTSQNVCCGGGVQIQTLGGSSDKGSCSERLSADASEGPLGFS